MSVTQQDVSVFENEEKKGAGKLYPLARLGVYLKRYPLMVGVGVFSLLLAALATLALPMAIRAVIDKGLIKGAGADINSYFVVLLLIVLVLAVSSALRFYCAYWLSERLVADLKVAVFENLLKQSAGFYDASHSGEIMSRLSADTTLINTAIRANVSQALRNVVLFVGALIFMVISSPSLSFLIICALPIVVLPLFFYGRIVRRLSLKAQDVLAYLHQFGSEMIGHVRAVQGFNAQGNVLAQFSRQNEEVVDAGLARTRARAALTAVAIFLVMASIVFILWYGARDVVSGGMSPGVLVQFMLYAVFAGGALGGLSEVWGEVAQAAGAMDRLSSYLDLKPDVKESEAPEPLKKPVEGAISFKDVDFTYPTRPDRLVLDRLSFTVEPGERVAILGPSGAGKSTIFHLLLRFYDPQSGVITLDNQRLDQLRLEDVRASFALVPQEPSLFHGSIADNIAFARPGAPRADVVSAAQVAQADEFITRFGDGYDTFVGEGGQSLSGGQRQRIALARALLANAPVLLLDEATSALDTHNEEQVQLALEETMKNRTSLIIAHRLSTVKAADRIIVLDQGRVVETGSHNELMAQTGGVYAGLVQGQLQAQPEGQLEGSLEGGR